MTTLEVRGMSVGYSSPILREVSFTLEAGQTVGLLGRNGSGKTTLLRGLTGSARVTAGQALVNGQNCLTMKPRQRARLLSLLSQRTGLMEGLRAGEVICMGRYADAGPFGVPAPGDEALCRRAAERLGIGSLWDRDCASLSEGQRQLVQLARVTAQDAAVLLLDEPNSALDFENSRLLFHCIHRLTWEERKGALVVMHDPALALRWCDKLLRLESGQITGTLFPAQASCEEAQAFLARLYPGILVRRDPESHTFYCMIP